MYRLVRGAGDPFTDTFCVMSAANCKHQGITNGRRHTDGRVLGVSNLVRELVIMLNDAPLYIDDDHRTTKLQPLIDLVVGSDRGDVIEQMRVKYLAERLGITYTPAIHEIGVISWELDKQIRQVMGLPNPEFIDYMYQLIIDVISIGAERPNDKAINTTVPFSHTSNLALN